MPQFTIQSCLNTGTKKLLRKKLIRSTVNLDSELLLSHILNKPREYILTHPEKIVSRKQKDLFFRYIQRRMMYEPVAYIIGKKEFYGRDFFVDKNVLIPRGATELLVEETLKYIYKLQATSHNLNIADIGTGSGCIAVTLAKELESPLTRRAATFPPLGRRVGGEGVSIYAVDISKKALGVAKKNAKVHNAKIMFHRGNLLEPLKNFEIDILVANLPYLNFKEKNNYKRILKHEPRQALYAKNNGLEYYQKLFRQIHQYKMFPGLLACEILPKQRSEFKKIATRILPHYKSKFIQNAAIVKKERFRGEEAPLEKK